MDTGGVRSAPQAFNRSWASACRRCAIYGLFAAAAAGTFAGLDASLGGERAFLAQHFETASKFREAIGLDGIAGWPERGHNVGDVGLDAIAFVRQQGVFDRAAQQGIPEPALRAAVERLSGEGIARNDLVPWLDNWIEAARRELDRSTTEDAAFQAARRAAERRFTEGRLAEASSPLMEAFEREAETAGERQEERKRRRLRLLEEAIRFDELAFEGEAAADKLRLMAEVEGISGQHALGNWLVAKAGEFNERGDQKGDNAALLVAVATYRAALQLRTRERVPLDWAATQDDLGNGLTTLGERVSGTAWLEEAVAAYRAALQERTRERAPLEWAATQNNLGAALWALRESENGAARLEEAVAAYRAALQERTRERAPLDWAMTQSNLGNVLMHLGERESGTARLEEAVAAYRAALEERTRARVPLDWATTQNGLGTALTILGKRESGTARLQEAVTAYQAALEGWTRERAPLDWAAAQHNLGNALSALGERESDTARLEEAVAAYRAALQERTPERAPFDWAGSVGNQGVALMVLAAHRADRALAETALGQISSALEVVRNAGHAPSVAYFEAQLGRAKALVERLI